MSLKQQQILLIINSSPFRFSAFIFFRLSAFENFLTEFLGFSSSYKNPKKNVKIDDFLKNRYK